MGLILNLCLRPLVTMQSNREQDMSEAMMIRLESDLLTLWGKGGSTVD